MPRKKKIVLQADSADGGSALTNNEDTFKITSLGHPMLNEWEQPTEDIKFFYINEEGKADFSDLLGGVHYNKFETFKIVKKHYKERMNDICTHINYFIKYYDSQHDFIMHLMSVKYLVDLNPRMSIRVFRQDLVMGRIITDQFVKDIKKMTNDLYTININTDDDGKYRSTPKLTNDQARAILAVSFAIRCILPLCIHVSNINTNIIENTDYIKAFDKIFMDILHKFEKNDIEIFCPLCNFIEYRLRRAYKVDHIIWEKKEQLYGITFEDVFQNMVHEVILVKALYKLEYNRSVVSYIDGVYTNSYNHFRFENFKFKPVEIDAAGSGSDSDDYLTHAESLEMSIYRIDESNQIVNEVNIDKVLKSIYDRFQVGITDEELQFYIDNCKINNLTQHFINAFYSPFFESSTAIDSIPRKDAIHLMLILKKFLQYHHMVILPQLCTAIVRGKFKENMINNSKFMEKWDTTSVYQNILKKKFKYIDAISPKENVCVKKLSTIINSTFTLIDTDPDINERILSDIPPDIIMDEYSLFLSII